MKRFGSEHEARRAFYEASNAKLAEGYVCLHAEARRESGYVRLLLRARPGMSGTFDLHPGTNRVILGGGFRREDGDVVVLVDLATGAEVDRIELGFDAEGLRAARASPDGRWLAVQDNRLGPTPHVVDLATGERRALAIPEVSGMADGLAFDASGERLLVTTPSKVFVVRTRDFEELFSIDVRAAGEGWRECAAALSADGRTVAFSRAGASAISVFDVESKALVRSLEHAGGKGAGALAFCPEGKLLFAAGIFFEEPSAHATLAWNLETGERHLPGIFAEGDDANDFAVEVSPDGRLVATGGYYSYVVVREVETGREVLRFFDHFRRVYDVRFGDGGRLLLTGDYNAGFVVVHELVPELLERGFEGPSF